MATSATIPSVYGRTGSGHYRLEEIEQRLRSGGRIDGVTKHDLPTPCLLVDLDLMEGNIEKMAAHAKAHSIGLRPHAKTHKCPQIARRQIEAGALGICTATISEAEVMARAGISGLLITSELVGPNKVQRLLRLTRDHPDTMTVVDHHRQAEQLSEAAAAAEVQLNIMIDIDPIGRRTGIQAGVPSVQLAKTVDALPNLNLKGVHSYSGVSSHVKGFAARKDHSEQYMAAPVESFNQMKKTGLPVEILSGCSTGTYNIDPHIPGITEMQVGSYVLMDVDYLGIGGQSGDVYDDFSAALTVLTTVVSKVHQDQATVDAGLKAVATDRKFGPDLKEINGVDYRFGGDEHGILTLREPSQEIELGDRLELIVPHCDPNVNLYDRMYCTRGEDVVEVWSVAARGHS